MFELRKIDRLLLFERMNVDKNKKRKKRKDRPSEDVMRTKTSGLNEMELTSKTGVGGSSKVKMTYQDERCEILPDVSDNISVVEGTVKKIQELVYTLPEIDNELADEVKNMKTYVERVQLCYKNVKCDQCRKDMADTMLREVGTQTKGVLKDVAIATD